MNLLRILPAAILSLCLQSAFGQQNAGPLNAAPGVPNQNPQQPNIASKTPVKTKPKHDKTLNEAIRACDQLVAGAPCEMKGINTKKVTGECKQAGQDDATLICKAN